LQPYCTFNDIRKLALNVEKQQKEVKRTSWKTISKESSSIRGSNSFSKSTTTTKSSVFKAIEKGSVRVSIKVVGSSSPNSKKCFKCQWYGHIAFDCSNRKIIVIMEEEIASEDDLLNESNQEDKVTYVDQGELLII